jgi:hypothetical protein
LIRPLHVRRLALTLQDTPPPSQTAYRTEALAAVGYFDPAFAYCPEIDLQYRVGEAGHWALFLEEALTHRNNDDDRLTSRLEWTPIPLRDHYRLLCRYGTANDPALVGWQRQRLRLTTATLVLRALKHGHVKTALTVSAAVGRCELELRRALRGAPS